VPATTPQTSTPAAKQRDPWFDNAKMALVTLVVLGHAWTLLPWTDSVDTLYDFLYAWHVPAFVFVTGYLSRSFQWDTVRMWRLVRTVVVPYLIFESLLAAFRIYVGGEHLEDLFQDPHWPMWYLSALFFWRLLTPLFRPMWGGVVVAVGISLVAGLYAGDTLDMARVLGLLPFFVMGLKATPEGLEKLRSATARAWAVLTMAAILVLSFFVDTIASTEWLYYRARYDELVTSDLHAFAIRAFLLTVGTAGAIAFLALVPRVGGWFARMGAWTLVVYLFHGFFIKAANYAGYMQWAETHASLALLVTSLTAVVLALLLAWTPLARRLNVLVDPLGVVERRVRRTLDERSEAEQTERQPARVG
jgi:fucose 4-O-acetylase-like acetyltransferase